MAGNVFFTIVPSQRELVASVERGDHAAAAAGSARAKRVSIHNNYFTFPVIALMLSSHFPSLYGAQDAWQIMLVLIAGGAAVRYILNLRYTLRSWQPILGATMAFALWLVHALRHQVAEPAAQPDAGPVTWSEVRHVIDRRCAACHSTTPTDATFGPSPGGVAFDTPEEVGMRAIRIQERAVSTRTMPPANKTGITDAERELLRRWFASGAPVR
jgi:uncharacterized membrane protein